jgi:shikimate kinase
MFEILGLAGSGKSTTIKYIKDSKYTFKDNIEYKKIDYSIMYKIFKLIQIFLITKNIRHVKEFITFLMLFKSIKLNNKKEKTVICFDQGPLFILTKLIIEIPEQEEYFLDELRKVIPYYNEIIYLKTPLEVLSFRINNREQEHRIKDKPIEEQSLFLKTYINLYNKVINICLEQNVNVIKINTDKHSIDEVGELVLERFRQK